MYLTATLTASTNSGTTRRGCITLPQPLPHAAGFNDLCKSLRSWRLQLAIWSQQMALQLRTDRQTMYVSGHYRCSKQTTHKALNPNTKTYIDSPHHLQLNTNHFHPLNTTIMWKYFLSGVRGGAVGWGTALQVGRSRVRFPMMLLEFFIDIILLAALWPWGWLSL